MIITSPSHSPSFLYYDHTHRLESSSSHTYTQMGSIFFVRQVIESRGYCVRYVSRKYSQNLVFNVCMLHSIHALLISCAHAIHIYRNKSRLMNYRLISNQQTSKVYIHTHTTFAKVSDLVQYYKSTPINAEVNTRLLFPVGAATSELDGGEQDTYVIMEKC